MFNGEIVEKHLYNCGEEGLKKSGCSPFYKTLYYIMRKTGSDNEK